MEAESLNNSENVEDNQQITDEEVTAKDLNSCSNGIKIKSVKNQNVEAIELVETPTKSRYIFSPQSNSVEIMEIPSQAFSQKFRESNIFTNQVTKELISQNIFSVRENFSFFHTVPQHTVWKLRKFTPTSKNFREINL